MYLNTGKYLKFLVGEPTFSISKYKTPPPRATCLFEETESFYSSKEAALIKSIHQKVRHVQTQGSFTCCEVFAGKKVFEEGRSCLIQNELPHFSFRFTIHDKIKSSTA